jgi:hypothetical protein
LQSIEKRAQLSGEFSDIDDYWSEITADRTGDHDALEQVITMVGKRAISLPRRPPVAGAQIAPDSSMQIDCDHSQMDSRISVVFGGAMSEVWRSRF